MKCTATTKANRPCRAYAVRGTDPPRCSVHRKVGTGPSQPAASAPAGRDFYRRSYSLEEIADLVAREAGDDLEDEISAARVATRRVMEQLQRELDPAEYGKLARVVFTGSNTVARLLRIQRLLARESEDGIASAIEEALDELEKDLGLEL